MKKIIMVLLLAATATVQATDGSYPHTSDKEAQVKNLGPAINTTDAEYTPFITPDEKFLFFQTNRQPSVGGEGDFDLWYSVNKNKDTVGAEPIFEVAANVGAPINSDMLDGHPTLRKLPGGEFEMYFASFATTSRPGPALTNIYFATWHAGKWSEPQPVAEVNSEYHDRMPSVSQDGKLLFFSSDRLGGRGNDDIWYSEWDEAKKKWGLPKNAGGINTASSELTPAIHADGISLYYSSNKAGGVGGSDIYFTQSVARLENENAPDILARGWSVPQNLGKPYNTEFDDEYPTIILSGERMYFTSNRAEGLGSFDVYSARLPEFARPVVQLGFRGKAYTGARKKPLPAKIIFRSGEVVAAQADANVKDKSEYALSVRNYKLYEIEASAEGYKKILEKIDTARLHGPDAIERNFAFVRSGELPQKVALEIEFIDSKKKNVNASVQVRVLPGGKKAESYKVNRGKVLIPLIDRVNFKDGDAAMTALDDLVIEIEAKKKGLADVREKREIAVLLDEAKGSIPQIMKVQITMMPAKAAEKPAKGKSKGKKGKKR